MKIRMTMMMVAAVLLASGLACEPGTPPIAWPDVVQCGPGFDDLVPVVSRVLLDGGDVTDPSKLTSLALAELERLAIEHSPEMVACVVDTLVNDWKAAGAMRVENGAPPDPMKQQGIARGQGFLQSKGVEVQRP